MARIADDSEFDRFDAMAGAVLAVSHDTLECRERAYKKQSDAKPVRPGPRRKRPKASAPVRASRAKD